MTKAKSSKLPIKKYLILIFIAVLLITNSTFSKYVSTSTGGSTAAVAIFASDVEIQVPLEKISPDSPIEITIDVSNYETTGLTKKVSEVSQSYVMTPKQMTGNIPLTFEWIGENGNKGSFQAVTHSAGNTYQHVLRITWDKSVNIDYTLADELEVIRILVDVEQID